MKRHDKKKYYNELREKYINLMQNSNIKNHLNAMTLIKSPGWEMFSKEERVMLLNASKLTRLKNGLLRSIDRVYNNPNFSEETKERAITNIVNYYLEMFISIRDQVDIIHAQKKKHGYKYTIEEKILDAKKIEAEKVKYFKPVRAK